MYSHLTASSILSSVLCLTPAYSLLASSFWCVCVCVYMHMNVYVCLNVTVCVCMCVRDWLTKSEGTSLIQVASPSCSLLSLTHEWFPQPSSPPLQWTPCSSPVHSTHWSALRVQQQRGRQGWKDWLASEEKMVKEWHSTYRKIHVHVFSVHVFSVHVHVHVA